MEPVSVTLFVSAFAAGVLMFLAPCTLPLVPAYLALISGVKITAQEVLTHNQHRRIIKSAFGFCIGFSLLFMLFGVGFGFLGNILLYRPIVTTAGGILVIILALSMLGWSRLPFTKGAGLPLPSFARVGSLQSSFLMGALFALGWTPCVGPVLATVLLFASSAATAFYGGLLLFVFSLGMATPFMFTAILYAQSTSLIARSNFLLPVIQKIGAIFLLAIGILMLTGDLSLLVSYGTPLFHWLGFEWIYSWI